MKFSKTLLSGPIVSLFVAIILLSCGEEGNQISDLAVDESGTVETKILIPLLPEEGSCECFDMGPGFELVEDHCANAGTAVACILGSCEFREILSFPRNALMWAGGPFQVETFSMPCTGWN